MKVSFELTLDDMVDAAMRGTGRSAVVRNRNIQARLITCLLAAVVGYFIGVGLLVVRNRAFRSAEERQVFLDLAREDRSKAGSVHSGSGMAR